MPRVPEYTPMQGLDTSPPMNRSGVQASAEAFGAGAARGLAQQGAAISQLGDVLMRVGRDVFEIDERMSQIAAQKALAKTRAETMQLLTDPETGYMHKTGEAAVQARQQYLDQYDQIVRTNAAGLRPHAQELYARFVAAHKTSDIAAINTHAGRELEKSHVSTLQTLETQCYSVAANSFSDDGQLQTSFDNLMANVEAMNTVTGRDKDFGKIEAATQYWTANVKANMANGYFEDALARVAQMDAAGLPGADELRQAINTARERQHIITYHERDAEITETIAGLADVDTPDTITGAYDTEIMRIKQMEAAGELTPQAAARLAAKVENAQRIQLARITRLWDAAQRDDELQAKRELSDTSFVLRSGVEQLVIDGAAPQDIKDAIEDARPQCTKTDAAALRTIEKRLANTERMTALDDEVRLWQGKVREAAIAAEREGFETDDLEWGDLFFDTQQMVVGMQHDLAQWANKHKDEGLLAFREYAQKWVDKISSYSDMTYFQRIYQPRGGFPEETGTEEDRALADEILGDEWLEETIDGKKYLVNPASGRVKTVEGE